MVNIQTLVLSAPAILFGLTIHEFCHGYVAWRLGDPTARDLGRLTLNPLKHLDPIGTVALFLFRFGWAKPVPIDPRYFRNPTRDLALASLAGPAANFLTAAAAGVIVRLLGRLHTAGFLMQLAELFVLFNLALCFFNLIPIPPLDGSRLLYYFLPQSMAETYGALERYGFLVLIGVILVGELAGIPILGIIIWPPVRLFSILFAGYAVV